MSLYCMFLFNSKNTELGKKKNKNLSNFALKDVLENPFATLTVTKGFPLCMVVMEKTCLSLSEQKQHFNYVPNGTIYDGVIFLVPLNCLPGVSKKK